MRNNIVILLSIILSFSLSMLIGAYFIYPIFFYVHEGGHFIFGYIDNLITNGKIAKISVGNWIEMPSLPFWKLPQQTIIIEGQSSALFVLGGFIFTSFIAGVISFYFYRKSKNYGFLIFFFIILLHEFVGNFLCGTDNSSGAPFAFCEQNIIVNTFSSSYPFLLAIPISFILYPYLNKKISTFFRNSKNLKKNSGRKKRPNFPS